MKLLFLIPIFLLFLLPFTQAQTNTEYLVPAENWHWNINPIPIHIIGSPADRNLTLKAMSVWEKAQTWFNNEYFPNDPAPVYKFIEVNGSAPVTFILQFGSNVPPYSQLAHTDLVTTVNRTVITGAMVREATDYKPVFIFTVAEHELARVLGIYSYGVSTDCCPLDLMTAHIIGLGDYDRLIYPSTLDIYAIYLMAKQTVQPINYLPSRIPYTTYPGSEMAVPEFGSYLMLIVSCCMLVALLTKRIVTARKVT